MIIWFLMILDLFSLVVASLAQFKIVFATALLIYSGIYFLLKFVVFREIMSGIDAVFGIYLILVAVFHFQSFMYYLMLAWVVYKTAFTISNFVK